jgi:hypothetical protein
MNFREIVSNVLGSDSFTWTTAATTVAVGLSNIESVLKIFSMIVGITATLVLVSNHLIKRRILLKQERMINRTYAMHESEEI